MADDRFATAFDWIYDLRDVRSAVIAPDDGLARFQTLWKQGKVDRDSSSVVVVGPEDLRLTGLLCRYKAGCSEEPFTIVGTMGEALHWLGIEAPALEEGLGK